MLVLAECSLLRIQLLEQFYTVNGLSKFPPAVVPRGLTSNQKAQ